MQYYEIDYEMVYESLKYTQIFLATRKLDGTKVILRQIIYQDLFGSVENDLANEIEAFLKI